MCARAFCSRRSTEGGQIGNKSERSTRGSRTRCSAYGKVPTLAGGLLVDSREVPYAQTPRATPARMRTSCTCTVRFERHDAVRRGCGGLLTTCVCWAVVSVCTHDLKSESSAGDIESAVCATVWIRA